MGKDIQKSLLPTLFRFVRVRAVLQPHVCCRHFAQHYILQLSFLTHSIKSHLLSWDDALFLGCGGRSEDTTSWGLIVGTVFFSVIYNFSRFFEFKVERITEEFIFSNATGQFKHIDQQNPLGKGYLFYFPNFFFS